MGNVVNIRDYHTKPKDENQTAGNKYMGLQPGWREVIMIFRIAKLHSHHDTWAILRQMERDEHMEPALVTLIKEIVFDILPNGDGGGRAA